MALAGPPAQSAANHPTAKSTALTHCVVTLMDEVQVPARDAGVLISLDVREGMQVKSGAMIARLDDADMRAKHKIAEFEYKIALEQAQNDVRVRAAQADAEITETEYLLGDAALPSSQADAAQARVRRLLLAPRRAALKTDVAKLDFRMAQLTSQVRAAEVEAVEQQLRRRQIESPLDGVVVRVYRNVGEWVGPGDAIAHVVRMDRLRVEGFVRAAEFSPEEIVGRPVTVTVQVTRGRTYPVTSRIAFASPIVETNGQYRVFAEIDNVSTQGTWLVRPGLSAEMLLELGGLNEKAN
jgi:multidrug efflux pump subunit AcrA (membrane-fusion protein)